MIPLVYYLMNDNNQGSIEPRDNEIQRVTHERPVRLPKPKPKLKTRQRTSRDELIPLALDQVDTTKPFCVSWIVDTDAWWTHNPDWAAS